MMFLLKSRLILYLIAAVLCMIYYFLCLKIYPGKISALWLWLIAAEYFGVLALLANLESCRVVEQIVFFPGLIAFFLFLLFCLLSAVHRYSLPQRPSMIVVLGAGDDLPPAIYRKRGRAAIRAARHFSAVPVLLTGTPTETAQLQEVLLAQGVAEERLIIESNSRKTTDNFKNTDPLLPPGEILIVTGDFHRFRCTMFAKSIWKKKNVSFYGAASPGLVRLHLAARECLTFYVDLFCGEFPVRYLFRRSL